MGRKNASQPERQLYLRTLSNLSNPSEVRNVLNMSRLKSQPEETPLTAAQIEFAHQMLPFRYSEVVDITSGNKNLLFAAQEGGAAYSELHMAAGERAILRLSQEVTQLNGALVLIDEVEAGLHPWVTATPYVASTAISTPQRSPDHRNLTQSGRSRLGTTQRQDFS